MRCVKDRLVLVTGATQGMGKHAAAKFVDEGAYVILVDVEPGPLKKTDEFGFFKGRPGSGADHGYRQSELPGPGPGSL